MTLVKLSIFVATACKRWGWEDCTTEVELISRIDRLREELDDFEQTAMERTLMDDGW